MGNEEADSMAEDVAYEAACSMVPGMGDFAPMAAHTLEMLQEANTNDALDTGEESTLERERALALQKGQAASRNPNNDPVAASAPRPSAH